MTDIRRSARVYSLLKAKIIFDGDMPAMSCLVKDISDSGAKIVVGNTLSIPNVFNLEIPMKAKTFRAEVRWRDMESLGLEFVAMPLVKTPSPDEVEAFKAEILRLGADVMALTKQLTSLKEHASSQTAQAG